MLRPASCLCLSVEAHAEEEEEGPSLLTEEEADSFHREHQGSLVRIIAHQRRQILWSRQRRIQGAVYLVAR
jgi:hypothetical protein